MRGNRLARPASRVLCFVLVSGQLALPALANPSGGQVVAGSATIHTASGSGLEVRQSSARAILDWDSFSIAAGEHTHFVQPSADAIALNRVRGGDVSQIFGALSADGRVVLVNGAGIHFGPSARVDVGGLIATTADVSDASFLSGGRLAFATPGHGAVVNEGVITVRDAGLAAFVAPWVENTGTIEARLGTIALASGDTFTLDLAGDSLLEIAVDDRDVPRGIASSGALMADGGAIALISADGARAALDGAINLSGVARARSLESSAGRIVLSAGDDASVRVSGTLDASGSAAGVRGGSITVTGGEITLGGGARVDASGDAGGGAIRVGGDVQGGGALLRARSLTVAAGAELHADALGAGTGGMIVAWSDGHTEFAGALSALGRGDVGGFAEISGHQTLSLTGDVALGQGGRLLLDPIELIVSDLPGATITAAEVRRQLVAGTTVSLLAADDIQILSTIDGRASFGAVAGGGLTLRSTAGNIRIDADVITNNGAITLDAALDVLMAPALGVLSGGNGVALVVSNGGNALGNAAVSIEAGGGATTQFLATRGAVTLATGGALTMARDVGTIDNPVASLTATAGTSIDLPANIVAANGPVSLTAGGDLLLALTDQILVSNGAGSSTPGVGAIALRYGSGDLDVGTLATAGVLTLAYTGAGASTITLHNPLGGTNSPLGGIDVDAPLVDVAAEIVAAGDVRLGRLGANDCAGLTGCTILRRSIFTRGGDFELRSAGLIDPRRALVDATGAPLLVTPVIGVDDAGNLLFGAPRAAAAIEELAASSFTPVTLHDDIDNPTIDVPFAERSTTTLVQNDATLSALFPTVFQERKSNTTGQGTIGERVETTWKVSIDTTNGASSGDVTFRGAILKPADATTTEFTGFLPASAEGVFLQVSPSQFFNPAGWALPGNPLNPFTSIASVATSIFEFFELGIAAGSSAIQFDAGISSLTVPLQDTNQLQLNIDSAGSLVFAGAAARQISALRIPQALLELATAPNAPPPALDDFSEAGFFKFQPVTNFSNLSQVIELRETPAGLVAFDAADPVARPGTLVATVQPRDPISTLPSTGTFTSTPTPGGGGLGSGGAFSFSGGGSGLFGGVSDLGTVPEGITNSGDVAAQSFVSEPGDLAEEDPAASGTEECPSSAPSAYQATPGQAAFSVDPRGGPFSVDAFCGAYRLVDAADPGGANYGDLPFVAGDFWSESGFVRDSTSAGAAPATP